MSSTRAPRDPAPAVRAHHLLCALGFRGLGYSPEFAANMASLLRARDASPSDPVAVTDARDSICAGFPAGQTCHCEDPEVVDRDRRVLEAIGLKAGSIRPWGELRSLVARAFTPADLDTLCATCPWRPLGYCAEGLARLRGRVLGSRPSGVRPRRSLEGWGAPKQNGRSRRSPRCSPRSAEGR